MKEYLISVFVLQFLPMDSKITLEEIVNAQAFKSAIEGKSVDDANSICMSLIVEALLKGYTNTPNV